MGRKTRADSTSVDLRPRRGLDPARRRSCQQGKAVSRVRPSDAVASNQPEAAGRERGGLAQPRGYRCRMADDSGLDEFEAMVVDAIDRLPEEFQEVLARVAVVVSELGAEVHAYGQYFGDGVARENFEDRIVIYRDTLERDFGHDRELLARQVERTLRHELAHHLGWDEGGVGGLGL